MRGGGNTNQRRRDEGDCGSGDDDTGKDQEQRVAGLKKRFETIQSEVEATNGEIENAKRIIEVAEEELNDYEVELSLKEAMDEFGLEVTKDDLFSVDEMECMTIPVDQKDIHFTISQQDVTHEKVIEVVKKLRSRDMEHKTRRGSSEDQMIQSTLMIN